MRIADCGLRIEKPDHEGTKTQSDRMDGQYVGLLGVFVSWWWALEDAKQINGVPIVLRLKRGAFFVAFEGLDQSGKKTLSFWLETNLINHGIAARRYAFPNYEGPFGELIKRYLDGEMDLSVESRYLLFAADRWQLRDEMVSLLQAGTVVIADRYSASGIAYGIAHNLGRKWLEGLEEGLPKPDFTFLVDIPVDTSFKRKPGDRDLYEMQSDLLSRVRRAYLDLAGNFQWAKLSGQDNLSNLQGTVIRKLIEADLLGT